MEAMSQQGQGYRAEVSETDNLTVQDNNDRPASRPRNGSTSNSAKVSAAPCGICGAEQSAIRINVDGNALIMESCDNCDIRRWQLEGERIDLQEALNQVGEHSGRRRSKA